MKTLQAIALILTLIGSQVSAHDLEAEASSPVWQVRYCVLNRFEVADATARRLLEKLCTDSHLGVANQAFAHYSSLFVSLDHQLVKAAFRRGDFNIEGFNVADPKVFQTPGFWTGRLKHVEAPDLQALAIRALGMCGTQEHVPLLLEYQKSDNPYLLHELAKALYRLGDEAGYLSVIESLLRLPPASAVHYQTLAIDYLLQTHPAQARKHRTNLNAAIVALPDLQPNWMCSHGSAHDLEADASSPVWQVRYYVTSKFEVADATTRRLLEKLCTDSLRGVANQAFAHYSSLFVSLDHQLVKAAFRRGDFNIDGVNVDDRYAFGQPSFWVEDLKETGAPDIQARAIRALGMCGTQEHVPLLLEYQKSDNPDLLYELAKALHRLGDEAGYLNVIESLLRLPPASAVYYQTLAIDCLLQTHPTQAREHWNKLHAAISALPDLQPNWMCAHILKENRLP